MQPLQPGDPVQIGRYRIGGRLGHGGMGEVFWGRSASGRPVAVKIVHRHLAMQPEFRARFAQEVDAARRVGGFHTAPVVDADPDGDPPWLVTAYVAGPSLAEAVTRTGPFPLPSLRALGAGLAEALEAVHAAGLVHRDLKPANILLTEDGPRVIDFGIARGDDSGLTATGFTVGTPRFMAPEQFGGSDPITGAADVFALGAVLCYAAGGHPFGEGSAATIAGAILTRQPDLASVPGPLVEIVARCLEKEPARRPTPAQLVDALSDGTSSTGWLPPPVRAMLAEHVLPDLPTAGVPLPPVPDTVRFDRPPPTRAWAEPLVPAPTPTPEPPARRGPLLGILAVAAIVAVAIVAGVYLYGGQRANTGNAAAVTTSVEPTPTAEPTTTTASEPLFSGNWSATPSDGAIVTLTITEDRSDDDRRRLEYYLSLTIEKTPFCDGKTVTADEWSRIDEDGTLPVTWVVTCPDKSDPESPYDERYTFDAGSDTLTDAAGNTYNRS